MSDEAPTTFLDPAAPSGLAGRAIRFAGVDLVDTVRLDRALDRYGEALHRRIFGTSAADHDRAAAAGLFGIKESVVKAMGGLPPGGRLADIDAHPDGGVGLNGVLAEWADTHGVGLVGGYTALRPGLTLSWALAVPAAGAATS